MAMPSFQSPDEDSLTPKFLNQLETWSARYAFQSPDEDSLTPK